MTVTSKSRARRGFPSVLLALCLAVLPPPAAAGRLDNIKLCFDPRLDIDDLLRDLPELPRTTVEVMPFSDTRFHPQVIGDARLGGDSFQQVTTRHNVAEWVTEHFAEALDDAGMKIGGGGELQIRGEVTQFIATKGPSYNGDIGLRISLQRGEEVLWRGQISGWAVKQDDDYDRGSAGDYCGILSDALLRAVASLLWYPRFREALSGQPLSPPAATPVPAPEPGR